MDAKKLGSFLWEGFEFASILDSIWQRIKPKPGDESKTHEDEPQGKTGKRGFKNERAMMMVTRKLKPQKRREVRRFHRVYFLANEGYWDRRRGNDRFEEYSTAVFTGWSRESREYGTKKTTDKKYHPRPDAQEEPQNGRGRRQRQTPHDYTETVTNEKLYSKPGDEAFEFVDELGTVLVAARHAHKDDPDGGDAEVIIAGHQFLKSNNLPRMPESGEEDWYDFFEKHTKAAPETLAAIPDAIHRINKKTARKQASMSWRQPFSKLMMKLLPF